MDEARVMPFLTADDRHNVMAVLWSRLQKDTTESPEETSSELLTAGLPGTFARSPSGKFKDFKDGKDGKDSKDGKEGKDSKEWKDVKDGKDGKDRKDGKEFKDTKDYGKDTKDTKDGKDRWDRADPGVGAPTTRFPNDTSGRSPVGSPSVEHPPDRYAKDGNPQDGHLDDSEWARASATGRTGHDPGHDPDDVADDVAATLRASRINRYLRLAGVVI
ncbi:hypothetical protein [Frankia sp. ACN10a]|nr:hypothetical protein [Frankia sp. ACN10a]